MKNSNPKPEVCPDEELLAAYTEGGLSEAERDRIEEHLVVCGKCIDSVVVTSELESSYIKDGKEYATGEMITKAKELVKPPEKHSLFWERKKTGLQPHPKQQQRERSR